MSRSRARQVMGAEIFGGGGDAIAPTCVITCDVSSPSTAATFNYTITFSEVVTGFEVGDFAITNGTKGALGGSGAVYTCAVTPTTGGTPVTANVAAGVAIDGAGNANLAAAQVSIDYYATIYYVRTNGNDTTGDGSTGAPWLTLVKAFSVAAVGANDLVRVGDGTYAEGAAGQYWSITKNCADWLTIEPENGSGGTVTITGNGHGTYNTYFAFATISHLRFRYLTFGMSAASLQAVRVTGNCTYVEFRNCTVTPIASATNGLYFSMNTSSNIVMDSCTITAPATDSYVGLQIGTNNNTSITISNNTIAGSANIAGKGLYVTGTPLGGTVTLTNNNLTAGLPVNVATGGTIAISGGTMTGSQVLIGTDGIGDQAAATATATLTNVTIVKTGTTGHALIFGNGCTGCVADNVTVASSWDYACVVKENTGTIVRNCHLTGGSGAALYFKAALQANAHDNVLTAATGYGFQMQKGDGGTPHLCGDWQLQTNTFVISGTAKSLNIGNSDHDTGGGICDYNTYGNNSGLGAVRADSNVANLTELQTAWADYDVTTNDAHSTVV